MNLSIRVPYPPLCPAGSYRDHLRTLGYPYSQRDWTNNPSDYSERMPHLSLPNHFEISRRELHVRVIHALDVASTPGVGGSGSALPGREAEFDQVLGSVLGVLEEGSTW